jgi:hypothetical protein
MGQQLVVPISRRTLASTVGTYEVDGIATIRIYRQGNRLLLDWPGNGVAEVFATPDGRLFCPPLTFSEVGTPWLDEAQMVPVAEHASRHRRIL